MMSQLGVRVVPTVPARVSVDDRRGKMRDLMEERMARSLGDVVGAGDRPTLIDGHFGLCVEAMADPAEADLPYPLDSWHLGEDRFRLVSDDRINAVHDPHQD